MCVQPGEGLRSEASSDANSEASSEASSAALPPHAEALKSLGCDDVM